MHNFARVRQPEQYHTSVLKLVPLLVVRCLAPSLQRPSTRAMEVQNHPNRRATVHVCTRPDVANFGAPLCLVNSTPHRVHLSRGTHAHFPRVHVAQDV